jgi:hypothetical protein
MFCPDPVDKMDFQDLATWCKTVQPRTITDLKPLLILTQSLLGDLIDGGGLRSSTFQLNLSHF